MKKKAKQESDGSDMSDLSDHFLAPPNPEELP